MKEPVVQEDFSEVKTLPYVSMTQREFVSVLLTGFGVGIIVTLLYLLLNTFVFGAVLCRPQSTGDCSQAPNYAMIVAIVIGTIGGVANLARIRIYRPLMVGFAAAIALWAAHNITSGFAWYWMLLALGVLFALAYAVFTWAARIRNFILALVVTVVLVVVTRWVLVS